MTKKTARHPQTGLTPQQEAFAQALVRGANQSDAYREAYPTSKRWKPEAVHAEASRLAADYRVRARTETLQQAATEIALERFGITVERVLDEIAAIAFSDVGSLFDELGQLKNIHDLTPAERACIASIEAEVRPVPGTEGKEFVTVKKIRLWNKNDSLEKLAKHLGLYAEDNKQKAASRLADLPRHVRDMILQHIDELIEESRTPDGKPMPTIQ